MDTLKIQLPPHHQLITERFVTICQEDQRVVAAFLGGSYITGKADAYSDLDLYLITTDEAYKDFVAGKDDFIRLLGNPLFLEDFGTAHGSFFIFADGTEGEFWIGRVSDFRHIHGGAYTVLLDRQGILKGVDFPLHQADEAEQVEVLRQQIAYFWHDAFHFIKAMGRKQLWFAYGELEILRRICLNLARLQHNLADPGVGGEPHFKIEQALPSEQLAPLQPTCCPLEYEAMVQAGMTIFQFYQRLAADLGREHGIPYLVDLENVVRDQLEKL
jgi:hypothetical protein